MTIGKEIGLSALMGQTMEECGELIVACSKVQRIFDVVNPPRCTMEEALKSLEEEATDVDNCLTRIREMGISTFNADLFVEKLRRWEDSVEAAKEIYMNKPAETCFCLDDVHDHSGLLEE